MPSVSTAVVADPLPAPVVASGAAPVSVREGLSRADVQDLQKQYAEEGYVVLRGVLSPDKLSGLRDRLFEEFERVRASGALFEGGGLLSGHLNCFPGAGSRFLYDDLVALGVIDLVRALSPKVERLPFVGCNLNLPKSATQHYHLDRPYTKEFIIVNIAVVDTDLENGAIDLVPRTHRKFYKFWRFALERPWRNAVRVQMKQGDILIRTSNLWHRGMPNHTDVPRPMAALTWEDGGSTAADPWAFEGGRIVFRPNWFRPDFLGRLRERTFLAAPISYDAYRFVRSLFGTKGYDH